MLHPPSIAFYIVNPNTVLQSVKLIERARYVHSYTKELLLKKIATTKFLSHQKRLKTNSLERKKTVRIVNT